MGRWEDRYLERIEYVEIRISGAGVTGSMDVFNEDGTITERQPVWKEGVEPLQPGELVELVRNIKYLSRAVEEEQRRRYEYAEALEDLALKVLGPKAAKLLLHDLEDEDE